ncbi:TPA: YccF domain-containing protein [Citrobacter amalonaticus]|uniref:Inner membrane protein YccF n=1 Tax=Citrobacter telavivensis TaxID=2653932 RepID=A0A6L5E1F5_9ENTR|nr:MULTISPECIES: YccF domain-containing protein [Citrobacter]EKZ2526296.1 YccF domain-containing protein [Citrobacter farmeri]HCL6627306.1 YccF domain-containing protein [Citrobacter amalonaticus]MPQ49342.1 YccF domain-containing protein [Citrobacter telavivensis]QFS72449.1 YccF domain-containing protein [Citrobacter telavivensis]CAI9397412.1 Inner membrane protein YccF [Citrobacter sp. T1.2D-1]
MRTVLNILNFVLGGFATTLSWFLATLVSIVLIFTLPLTRSCWEITKLSLLPYGNEAVHVDELDPAGKNVLLNTGGTLLNIFWLIFFGWWLCLMHIAAGITQCITIIGIPVGIANFKIAAIALWPVGRRVVSVEVARAAREANARRRFESPGR